MDEEQLRDYIQRNIVFGSGTRPVAKEVGFDCGVVALTLNLLLPQHVFPVSAKYAQFANTARTYLAEEDVEVVT